MIPREAEAAAAAAYRAEVTEGTHEQALRAALEAAAPHMLSHERQLTADAHRDAIVNRDNVDRLERELETAKADAWDEGMWAMYNTTSSEWPPIPTTNPYRSQA